MHILWHATLGTIARKLAPQTTPKPPAGREASARHPCPAASSPQGALWATRRGHGASARSLPGAHARFGLAFFFFNFFFFFRAAPAAAYWLWDGK